MERLVAQNAGVVHDDVNLAKSIDCGLHDGGATFCSGNAVVVCNCLTTECLDFVNDALRCRCIRPTAVNCATEVIDDHECATLGEQQRMLATESASGTSDDRYFAVETEICHVGLLA
jgi:hypothetical protein